MDKRKAPWWMVAVIIVLMLPVFQFPELLATCPLDSGGVKTLLYLYPAYVALTGWLAYICYPSRKTVSWILLFLMALSHVAMYLLVGVGV